MAINLRSSATSQASTIIPAATPPPVIEATPLPTRELNPMYQRIVRNGFYGRINFVNLPENIRNALETLLTPANGYTAETAARIEEIITEVVQIEPGSEVAKFLATIREQRADLAGVGDREVFIQETLLQAANSVASGTTNGEALINNFRLGLLGLLHYYQAA
ncbi:MAG: hypothetical protein ABIH69_04755 [bacterium]